MFSRWVIACNNFIVLPSEFWSSFSKNVLLFLLKNIDIEIFFFFKSILLYEYNFFCGIQCFPSKIVNFTNENFPLWNTFVIKVNVSSFFMYSVKSFYQFLLFPKYSHFQPILRNFLWQLYSVRLWKSQYTLFASNEKW